MIQNSENAERFIRAYHDFRKSVDFSKNGILPRLDNVIWGIVMGIPDVPADDDPTPEGQLMAVDQRVAILKAVFVELNKDQKDDFLDQGLTRYDQASRIVRDLLAQVSEPSNSE